MKRCITIIGGICLSAFLAVAFPLISVLPVQAAERLQEIPPKPVIVIDPGHGGDNLGTIENGHEEKSMTLTTALAMYEELCSYENVEVYLTRSADVDMKIEDRVIFAAEKNADFLFSIHYNASENHELFGSEIWISAFSPYNNYGYQFGYEFLKQMEDRGLFIRGIKTRLNDKGEDYYGILRFATARSIPSAILEHCHVDESRDTPFCDGDEQLKAFGKADAQAVARYLGLKKADGSEDYTGYSLKEVSADTPVQAAVKDDTPPDICQIEPVESDYEAGTLTLSVSAADYDSVLLYYSYSLDGGTTYSRREIWPESDALKGTYTDTFELTLDIPDGTTPAVIVRAYNQYDLYTESNCYQSPAVFERKQESESETADEESSGESFEIATLPGEGTDAKAALSDNVKAGPKEEREVSLFTFLIICLCIVSFLFVLLFISQLISMQKKRRRRNRKSVQERKEPGNNSRQPR